MHARMLSVVVFLAELSTVARRVLLLELSTHCSRLYELVRARTAAAMLARGARLCTILVPVASYS
eukprot:COSAG05_NODE_929_length_6558_cov_3.005264_6_plen_65_part_00